MSFGVVRWWTGGIPWSSRSPAYIPPGLIGAPICLVTCHTHPDRQPIEYAAARFFGYATSWMRDFLDVRISGRATFWTWVNTVSQPSASHCIHIAVNLISTSMS